MRVLGAHQRDARDVIVGPAQRVEQRAHGHDAALARDRVGEHARVRGDAPLLVVVDVRLGLEQHLVAGLREHLHRDLIGHGAARHEQRRLLAGEFGHAGLQAVDRRVVPEHVVADLGFGHGATHPRRWDGSRYHCADRRRTGPWRTPGFKGT
jgi:hypothetical protein